MPEDEKKKEINSFLIYEKYYKVFGIVSTKINTLMNYLLFNGALD